MIESCTTLRECESILATATDSVHLLGEVPLSNADVAVLLDLVSSRLASDLETSTSDLKETAPTCFALFLVWMGITEYEKGNYWGAIHQVLGCEVDVQLQHEWISEVQVALRELRLEVEVG